MDDVLTEGKKALAQNKMDKWEAAWICEKGTNLVDVINGSPLGSY